MMKKWLLKGICADFTNYLGIPLKKKGKNYLIWGKYMQINSL